MTEITEVVYEAKLSKNGDDVAAPKKALVALGLPTEYQDITGQGIHVNLTLFRTRDGQHLGTRDRLVYPSRRVYWSRKAEAKQAPYERVRVHMRQPQA
jgi:hypothetical protein